MTSTDPAAAAAGLRDDQLDARLKTLLPPAYHACYEEMQPVSMGSAGLKYDADGRVAWDEIWQTFCDLAMAGGPPHKGALLQAGVEAEIDADFGRYDAVVEEICRGIRMVTGLRAYPSPAPGWVSVSCQGDTMAEWLLRAVVMENVAARRAGAVLELPAAPHFRVEKEIKNVITVIAKTTHYWLGHIPRTQQRQIGDLFMRMGVQTPLLTPAGLQHDEDLSDDLAARCEQLRSAISARIAQATSMPAAERQYPDWCGVACAAVPEAVWMMRALVTENVLARREERTLFVPVNPAMDPDGSRAADAVARVYAQARARGIAGAA